MPSFEVDFPEYAHHFADDAKDLIQHLLQRDTTRRYGCMKDSINDIKQHPWFAGISSRVVQTPGISTRMRRSKSPLALSLCLAPNFNNFDVHASRYCCVHDANWTISCKPWIYFCRQSVLHTRQLYLLSSHSDIHDERRYDDGHTQKECARI